MEETRLDDSPEKLVLSWEDIVSLSERLAERLARAHWDRLLLVARGGLIPGALVAQHLGERHLMLAAVASYAGEQRGERLEVLGFPPPEAIRGLRIAIIDDVWDSGRTAVLLRERVSSLGGEPIVAVLHYKPAASCYPDSAPDIWIECTGAWIVYPWERSLLIGREAG